jgi:hypothetical protein
VTDWQYLCGCGHTYPAALGKYGCPNCEGEYHGTPVPVPAKENPADVPAGLVLRDDYRIAALVLTLFDRATDFARALVSEVVTLLRELQRFLHRHLTRLPRIRQVTVVVPGHLAPAPLMLWFGIGRATSMQLACFRHVELQLLKNNVRFFTVHEHFTKRTFPFLRLRTNHQRLTGNAVLISLVNKNA